MHELNKNEFNTVQLKNWSTKRNNSLGYSVGRCPLYVKFMSNIQRARSLAMQIKKSLAESHPRVTSMQISEDEGVTSAKNSEAIHVVPHPVVTSKSHIHIRTKSSHFQGGGTLAGLPRALQLCQQRRPERVCAAQSSHPGRMIPAPRPCTIVG